MDRYSELVENRSDLLDRCGPIVAGFSATTDALHHVDAAGLARLLAASGSTPSLAEGVSTLQDWLRAGRDGELFIDDVAAEPALEAILGPPARVQCGGTSIQASWSWSELGLNPLLALRNRSARQLRATPDGVRLAVEGGTVPAGSVDAEPGVPVPSNHVLELARGLSADDVHVTRSSRITVVMARKQLQLDEHFLQRSAELVRGGVGLVSGLNGLASASSADVLGVVAGAAAAWREAGARLVHLELAEYARPGELGRVMRLLGPHVHSVGMNGGELTRLVGAGDPAKAAAQFATAFGLRRVVVHADRWAMSVHRGDPATEELALAAGSLAAANRAEEGRPRAQWRVPAEASFAVEIPDAVSKVEGYRVSVVATPYLTQPRSTIGLGDTFVSGDLLIQGGTDA
ncbi:ADP-dependent glucokinase/phosphofructokinase [Ruania rhizosphaerae]|uniref:ADP-dependent glucokinase/phosphofructokinase n=1 Tax=Ruania rhizosphaerae TaxID=1840413 RepID=UPI00135C8B73|nr:ADP-dependent glucokinase/phosphofructokinase [Ruania rhizosphaerae]